MRHNLLVETTYRMHSEITLANTYIQYLQILVQEIIMNNKNQRPIDRMTFSFSFSFQHLMLRGDCNKFTTWYEVKTEKTAILGCLEISYKKT